MKQKFKFKALSYDGKVVHITKEFDYPDFEVIPPKEISGYPFPETTVISQLMDWFDGVDKRDFMEENDLYVIIDYWIPEPKTQKKSIIDVLKELDLSEQMLLDIIALYPTIKHLLKGKSADKQFEIIFSHLDIGYKAATEAYRSIYKTLTSPISDELRVNHSNKKLITQ